MFGASQKKKGGGLLYLASFSGKAILGGGGGCYKTPVNMLLYKVNTNKTIDHLMQYFWQSRKFIEKIRASQEIKTTKRSIGIIRAVCFRQR